MNRVCGAAVYQQKDQQQNLFLIYRAITETAELTEKKTIKSTILLPSYFFLTLGAILGFVLILLTTHVTMRKQGKLHNEIHLCNKLCYRLTKTTKMVITSGKPIYLNHNLAVFKSHLTTPCKNQPVSGALLHVMNSRTLPSVGIKQRETQSQKLTLNVTL